MIQDTYLTDVTFRVDTTKEFKNTVFALMPHECADQSGNVNSYEHIGQHSAANYSHCISKSRLATATEYEALKTELEGLGYNLNIVKKQNYKKFLESYQKR